jgi:hypothetical protein
MTARLPDEIPVSSPAGSALPPDPDAYDSPRASQARARGLAAPYIAGGEDPEIGQTRSDERRLVRLLVLMIVIVVLAGFVLGIVAKLLGFDFLLGVP